MISFTTQRKLAQIIQSLSEGERKVEVVRQVLAENREFEPYTAFKRIDRTRKGFITSSDLKLFLQENDVFLASRELFNIFRHYDNSQNGKLIFSDFCKNVLPQEDPILRKVVTQRDSRYIDPSEILPFEVEWALARVFDQEAKNYRANEALREILISAIDFNIRDAFNSIDDERFGYIDQNSVDNFMKSCDKVLSEEEIYAFFRVVDLDEDGRISYTEFVEAILPFEPYNRRTVALSDSKANLDRKNKFLDESKRHYHTDIKRKLTDDDYYDYLVRSNSAEKRKRFIESTAASSRIKSANYSSSPFRRSYPVKTYAENRMTAEKEYTPRDRALYSTPTKINKKLEDLYESKYLSGAKKSNPGSSASKNRSFEEEQLVKSLKDQINFDRELEEAKKRLALRSDFNLLDAFKIFDKRGKGYISLNELEKALHELAVFPTKDELYLFFRRYDKDSDGLLRYSDFCKAITPQSSEYAKLLSNRTPLYLNTVDEGIENFTNETRRVLKNLMNSLIEVEISAERIRQKLSRRPLYSIHDAFQIIDRNENGFITLDEFRDILDDYGIFATTNDLINLVKRYDKNMDGRVSYTEFINEMTPKAPSKY